MAGLVIAGGRALVGGALVPQDLVVADGKIVSIGGPAPSGAERIEAGGKLVLPGLIDVHVHGRLVDLDPTRLPGLVAQDSLDAARAGVTGYLLTLASAPIAQWLKALPVLAELVRRPPPGARPLGVHLEGVFLNPRAGGAHPGGLLQVYDPARPEHRAIFDRHGDVIKMVTFAPEVAGNERLIDRLRELGAVMSLGHSAASSEQVRAFADRGVSHATHLFNGMSPVHHRAPGPVVGALLDDRVSVDLICDGHHLHPDIVRLIHRIKPAGKRVLITDGVVIQLPGATAGAVDEPNRLPDGRFAGSRLRLASAVSNYSRFTGCPLPEAYAMASAVPADLLGLGPERGRLQPGAAADLCLANEEMEIEATWVAGERVF